MKTHLMRGLAALCLLALAPRAHGLVVSTQYFSTTGAFSGNYAPFGVPSNAFWNIAQTTGPLTVAVIDLTVSGSVTLVEANPWQGPISWTPTLGVQLASGAPGYAQGANFQVTGAPQLIAPPAPGGNSRDGAPATLHFTMHFSGIISGAGLASYVGGATTYFNSTAMLTPLVQFGRYQGTVTHTARVTFNAPEGGGGAALLAAGLGLCVIAHRVQRRRGVRDFPGA